MAQHWVLRSILALIGVAIMALGLNIGLGGIATLGWQSEGQFFSVQNPDVFRVQDSHIRFVGGIWFGVGGVFACGAAWLRGARTTLIVMCVMIAVAGLFRLSGSVQGVWPSLLFELVGFPLLGFWLART